MKIISKLALLMLVIPQLTLTWQWPWNWGKPEPIRSMDELTYVKGQMHDYKIDEENITQQAKSIQSRVTTDYFGSSQLDPRVGLEKCLQEDTTQKQCDQNFADIEAGLLSLFKTIKKDALYLNRRKVRLITEKKDTLDRLNTPEALKLEEELKQEQKKQEEVRQREELARREAEHQAALARQAQIQQAQQAKKIHTPHMPEFTTKAFAQFNTFAAENPYTAYSAVAVTGLVGLLGLRKGFNALRPLRYTTTIHNAQNVFTAKPGFGFSNWFKRTAKSEVPKA